MRSPACTACTDQKRRILRVQSSRLIFTGGFRSWPPATCRFSIGGCFDHHGKGNGYYKIGVSKKWKKKWNLLVSLIDLIVMNAIILFRDGLWLCQACKRGRRPTERNFRQDPHSYPQTHICSALYSDHDDTHTHTHTHLTKSQGAVEPRRPPMTDVVTETTFRLDQRKHFQKSKHNLSPRVSWWSSP